MTAKHRKGKGNPKNEDNFLKPEIVESDVHPGRNNNAVSLALILLTVVGVLVGVWICFQQHQTLAALADSLEVLQLKMAKLHSSHEELRQSNDKLHATQSLETRLTALEDSCAQKQVNMALAASEESKVSELSAQVLSLHTEMTARVAELEKTAVTLDQMKEKSEEMEQMRLHVEGLTALSTELSQHMEVLTVSQGEAEAKLDDGVGRVAVLNATVEAQAAEVLRVKEQLDSFEAQLEASALEVATVRDTLEKEHSQQPNIEEEILSVRGNLMLYKSDVQKFQKEVWAELEHIQRQILQMMATPRRVTGPDNAEEVEKEEVQETGTEETEGSAAEESVEDKEIVDQEATEDANIEEAVDETEEVSEVEDEDEAEPDESMIADEVEVGNGEEDESEGAESKEESTDEIAEDPTLEVSAPKEDNLTVEEEVINDEEVAAPEESQGGVGSELLELDDDDNKEEH